MERRRVLLMERAQSHVTPAGLPQPYALADNVRNVKAVLYLVDYLVIVHGHCPL